ncbi:MAG: 4'-phosphopantetheinyl transferase superfamily protein [Erysipelotrichaceae bacterium]|nr:4'-phosphopantetheinyl transferase superfamily protein [Erysipelotrichaceae bacterium]
MAVTLYISNMHLLDNSDYYERAYQSASSQRKGKIDHFYYIDDKKRALMAELLLREALIDRGIKETEIKYEFSKNGKPYLKNFNYIHFNIAHSGDFVILAVSDKEIGCDIERIRDLDIQIAERFFTNNECKRISVADSIEERQRLFISYWTLKESYLKYTGEGLKQPLNSFDIDVIKEELVFKEFDIIPGYHISLCMEDKESEIRIINISNLFPGKD